MFTRQQLVAFGNYLLSEERKSNYTGEAVEERLSKVNHSDVENWIEKELESIAETGIDLITKERNSK